MAKIIWQKRASKALDTHLLYAYSEFGKSTAKRWLAEIAHVESRIASMPLSYTQEPLLSGKKRVYRYCHLMNRRFKLIYCYYPSSNIVRIADIWDTRVNPETLTRRIK
jgi:plasmid stabilization system protein ParE